MPAEPATPPTPAATYISAAIPRDSIDHFVLLMTASELQPAVATSIALAKVLKNIPRQGTEPQITRLKLNWWLEEIEMIGRDKARHPLSVELCHLLDHQAWLDPLRALVHGTLGDIDRQPFQTLADLLPYCHRISERQALIASVLPCGDQQALAEARKIGVGICLTEMIHDRHEPGSLIPANGFDGQAGAALAAKLADIADNHFEPAGPMPVEQRRAQCSVLLQGRLYRRLLERLRRNNFERGLASVPPLTHLWHAWREARNLIK